MGLEYFFCGGTYYPTVTACCLPGPFTEYQPSGSQTWTDLEKVLRIFEYERCVMGQASEGGQDHAWLLGSRALNSGKVRNSYHWRRIMDPSVLADTITAMAVFTGVAVALLSKQLPFGSTPGFTR